MRLPITAPCATCGAPVHWGILETGARAPIDPAPVTVALQGEELLVIDEETRRFRLAEALFDAGRPRYRDHRLRCKPRPRGYGGDHE